MSLASRNLSLTRRRMRVCCLGNKGVSQQLEARVSNAISVECASNG